MRILLVEDESLIAKHLKQALEKLGYSVQTAADGEEGLWYWQEEDFDLVLLDLGLPKLDGLSLLQQRRAAGDKTPVLILTARNAWQERVEGLQAGADDYVGKPFHFEELQARIVALLRRLGVTEDGETIQVGDLTLNLARKEVTVDGKRHTLTAVEFTLLSALMRRPGQVLSKVYLMELMTEDSDDKDLNMVEVYISRLRRLVGAKRIKTLRGQGYQLCEETD